MRHGPRLTCASRVSLGRFEPRADSDAKFDVMRQEMNERFRSLTTVLTTGVAVLATILVGIVGAIIGLYARTG